MVIMMELDFGLTRPVWILQAQKFLLVGKRLQKSDFPLIQEFGG